MTVWRVISGITNILNISTNLSKKNQDKNCFEFKEITSYEEVRKAIKDLNPKKSSGYDRLDPKILKRGPIELAPPRF